MKRLPVAIIEDELRNQKLLAHIIDQNCPELEIIGYAKGVNEALELIQKGKPSLIFLDIQLKDGNGFEILNKIAESDRPRVIFTTAFDEYALKAFKFSAVNYLLKPIDKIELIESVNKAIEIERKEEMSSVSILLDKMMSSKSEQMITVSGLSSTDFINISEIIHITAMGGYSKIILKNGRSHTVSKVIKTYDNMLVGHGFFRAHQSHLINLKSVKKLNKGDHTIILENGDEISIARSRKEAFMQAMAKLIL